MTAQRLPKSSLTQKQQNDYPKQNKIGLKPIEGGRHMLEAEFISKQLPCLVLNISVLLREQINKGLWAIVAVLGANW